MAPRIENGDQVLDKNSSNLTNSINSRADAKSIVKGNEDSESSKFKPQWVWRNVLLMGMLHLMALYGLWLAITSAKWQTSALAYFLYIFSGLGITAGVHRMWSHKSYKAKLPWRALLAIQQTMAFQNSIFEWSRDHRVHHKFSETDADPHNSNRGFFFAHVGWLLMRKHPDVIKKGASIDMSDLLRDPVVRFQRKYYLQLVLIFCFIIPTLLPKLLWNETLWNGFFICALFRYCWTLNMTWLVNSAAHMFGHRPYDTSIEPRENLSVTMGTLGEGYHNYHHTFPWDYRASEWSSWNLAKAYIDLGAALGLVYDRKIVNDQMIKKRIMRTGPTNKVDPVSNGHCHPEEADESEAIIIDKDPNYKSS